MPIHACSATEKQLIDPAYKLFDAKHRSYEILSDKETTKILKNDLLMKYYAACNKGITNNSFDEVRKNCNKILILDSDNKIAKENLSTVYEIKTLRKFNYKVKINYIDKYL